MRHDIVELPSVPRKRDELRAIIGTARYQRRKSNLIRWAAYNLIGWALILIVLRTWPQPVPSHQGTHSLYIPVISVVYSQETYE